MKSRSKTRRPPGSLRIVAGRLGGRRIRVPGGERVRPTPDRVREALFSILGGSVHGKVLDLYAGSGALGLEALSRGASNVTFVECDGGVLEVLRGNVTALGVADECLIVPGEVEAVLVENVLPRSPFDLVLADPPYGEHPGGALLAVLHSGGFLAREGVAVVERESVEGQQTILPDSLTLYRTERYGRVSLDFFRRRR